MPGPDYNLVVFGSYIGKNKEIINYFTTRKFLQDSPVYGTGVVVQAQPIPEIVEMSRRFLYELDYYGICEIEYKQDQNTTEYRLIEINPRHWDHHQLGTLVGVNLTQSLYEDWTGRGPDRQTQSETVVKWVAEQDATMLAKAMLGKGPRFADIWRVLRGHKIFSVFHRCDPGPSFYALLRILEDLSGLLFMRLWKTL